MFERNDMIIEGNRTAVVKNKKKKKNLGYQKYFEETWKGLLNFIF